MSSDVNIKITLSLECPYEERVTRVSYPIDIELIQFILKDGFMEKFFDIYNPMSDTTVLMRKEFYIIGYLLSIGDTPIKKGCCGLLLPEQEIGFDSTIFALFNFSRINGAAFFREKLGECIPPKSND